MMKLRLNLQMFGATTSKSTNLQPSGSGTRAYTLTASFVENSTDVVSNNSNITATATLQANGTYWTSSYNSTLEIYWYDNRTGIETLKDSIDFKGLSGYRDSKTITATFNVQHNNDGTLSGYAKARFVKGSTTTGNAPPDGNVSTSLTALTTIARVSNITCTSPYVGDTATITITRNDNSFTDTITYSIGSLNGTIATRTTENVIGFDTSLLSSSVYSQMGASNTSIQGTITVQTYNGNGISIGTKSVNFNLYAKEIDCKPLISFDVETTDQLSETLTGNNTTFINGISDTSITYTITPRNSASITRKYAENYGDLTNSPITNWKLTSSNLTLIAIDTRQYQTSLTKTLDFVPYFSPTATISAYRTTPTGSEIKAKFQGTFFNNSFGNRNNSLTLICKYKIKNSSTWITLKTLVLNTDYKINGNKFYSGTGSSASDIVLDSNVFDYQNAYDVALFYNDEIVSSFIMITVAKGVPAFNWGNSFLNANGHLTISDVNGENRKEIRDLIYPIGSIYLSVNNVNPTNLFGGTWVAFGTGRTLVGVDTSQTEFNTVEKTGGEKTHTLTINEMPSHNHDSNGWASVTDGSGNYNVFGAMNGGGKLVPTRNTGGGQPHNILQPYITCYMWKRTA